MTTWYRIQDADRDPQALLDPANQWSHTWHPTRVACQDCNATGLRWTADSDDPEDCATCDGKGERDEAPRRGVSVCMSVIELAGYFRRHEVHPDFWEDEVMVTLEGALSGEDDYDDGEAYLVIPERIVSVTPVREVPELAELLAEVSA